MQAAERPCIIRPVIKKIAVPLGDAAISSDPIMLKTSPIFVILTRPNLSPKPPMTTIKIPENRAVILTAILLVFTSMPKSVRMVGAIFKVVCAKSQKVITPKTIPSSNLSFP